MTQTNPADHIEPRTSRGLLRSTVIAGAVAAALLVTIVLPAEYGVDPSGIGRLLGLREMGEIKVQLAREAQEAEAAEALATTAPAELSSAAAARLDTIERRLEEIYALLAQGAAAGVSAGAIDEYLPAAGNEQDAPAWRDEITITLTPGQGVEYKLVMTEGAEAEFEWTANGGAVNYDTHGNGNGNSISYEQGRAVPQDSGVLVAAFNGDHGWFFRNRTDVDVQLTLRTRGDYAEFKRTV